MSVLPELLLWEQASVNLSCGGGRVACDVLRDLGPPPDMILNLPPPPVPPHLEEIVSRLAAEALALPDGDNRDSSSGFGFASTSSEASSCELCLWATGNNIGFVELAQKGELLELK